MSVEKRTNLPNAGVSKRKYEKPTLQVFELRPEERIAGSVNCAAAQGSIKSKGNPCVAGTAWSHMNQVP